MHSIYHARRGAADSNAPRIPPSPIGCLDDWMTGWIGGTGGIGWDGLDGFGKDFEGFR